MTKIKVILEFDEKELGEKWMNPDNLEVLLYTDIYTNGFGLGAVAEASARALGLLSQTRVIRWHG